MTNTPLPSPPKVHRTVNVQRTIFALAAPVSIPPLAAPVSIPPLAAPVSGACFLALPGDCASMSH